MQPILLGASTPAGISLADVGDPAVTPPYITDVGLTIEIAFTSGTWTDVSDDVDLSTGLTITRPAFVLGETASATTLDLQLKNAPNAPGITKYTPDNPMGPYFPNIVRDKMIRVTATKGGTNWVRFLGFVDRWEPDSSSGEPNEQYVALTASSIIGRYARKTLLSHYAEMLLWYARDRGRAIDLWPLNDGDSPTTLRNVGFDAAGSKTGALSGKVVQSAGNAGQVDFSTPDGGLMVDGVAAFTRADDNKAGPVLKLQLQDAPVSRVSFWAKMDGPAVNYDDIAAGFDSRGTCLWRIGVTDSVVTGRYDIAICKPDGTVIATYNVGNAADQAWRWYSILFSNTDPVGPTIVLAVRTAVIPDALVTSNYYLGLDMNGTQIDGMATRYITVGGYMPPRQEGANRNTFLGSVGGVYVMHGVYGDTSYSYTATPLTVGTANGLVTNYSRISASLDSLVGGSQDSGSTDTTPAGFMPDAGTTLADAWSTVATTMGGVLSETPAGKRRLRKGFDARPRASSFSIHVEQDGTGGPVWSQVERPTRITVTCPGGSVTVIDAVTEAATGLQSDSTISTAAADTDTARQVAGLILTQGNGLTLAQVAVELNSAENNRWNALMSMLAGDRATLTGLPVGYYGTSSVDFFVSSWTEQYTPDAVTFTLATIPADSPPLAVTDDQEYGRVGVEDATVTGGTCIGSTAVGTLVVTSPTAPWSTQAADYPMDLNWSGERVTIGSAPPSSTSPQTLTVTARGNAPTGARAHSTGEPIDVWHAAAVAF